MAFNVLFVTFWAFALPFSWALPSPLVIACFACYLLGIALLIYFGHLPSLLVGHCPPIICYSLFKIHLEQLIFGRGGMQTFFVVLRGMHFLLRAP